MVKHILIGILLATLAASMIAGMSLSLTWVAPSYGLLVAAVSIILTMGTTTGIFIHMLERMDKGKTNGA